MSQKWKHVSLTRNELFCQGRLCGLSMASNYDDYFGQLTWKRKCEGRFVAALVIILPNGKKRSFRELQLGRKRTNFVKFDRS